jgi:hypothetical protein
MRSEPSPTRQTRISSGKCQPCILHDLANCTIRTTRTCLTGHGGETPETAPRLLITQRVPFGKFSLVSCIAAPDGTRSLSHAPTARCGLEGVLQLLQLPLQHLRRNVQHLCKIISLARGNGRFHPADSGRSRPSFRDDAAHHSGMISPGVGCLCWPTQVRSFGFPKERTGCQQRERPCATCAKCFG